METSQIWNTLVSGQIDQATKYASSRWYGGLKKMDLQTLPILEDLTVPHWRVQGILGKSPEPEFWYRLARGIFNVNMRLRSEEELHYLEERDYFHDTFGHLPILWDKEYSDYVRALGIFAQYMADTDAARRAISNAYWMTSEFGLVDERGQLRAYGAGILSSIDELQHAMSDDARKLVLFEDIHLDEIAHIPGYVTNGFQDFYVVLPSWDALPKVLKFLWENYTK